MVEQQVQEQKPVKRHPQQSGVEEVKDERAKALIDKVIDKLVRVTVADGRVYLGKLMAVDQTRTLFVQDALELYDKEDQNYVAHELITPHLLDKVPAEQRYFFKMVGNIVVPGKQVTKVELDKRFQ